MKTSIKFIAASVGALIIAMIVILTLTAGATQTSVGATEDPTAQPVGLTIKDSTEEIDILAKLMWGEARGVQSDAEKAAVAWCVLNRVDDEYFPNSIKEVVEAPYQFIGYNPDNPVENNLKQIAADVLRRWELEKEQGNVAGRTLPREYKYFWGDGEHNHFTIEWLGDSEWDWSLPSPYSTQ